MVKSLNMAYKKPKRLHDIFVNARIKPEVNDDGPLGDQDLVAEYNAGR